jgi:two-component system response regulator NreC
VSWSELTIVQERRDRHGAAFEMARVFICDDDEHYRALLRAVLDASERHEIVGEAANGQSCIDAAPSTAPDVVLLDLNMPRMSGFEALPSLRVVVPKAKILALTSARAADDRDRFLELGGDGFIEKPRSAFSIPDAIDEHLAA